MRKFSEGGVVGIAWVGEECRVTDETPLRLC